jgi:hypothetical protein
LITKKPESESGSVLKEYGTASPVVPPDSFVAVICFLNSLVLCAAAHRLEDLKPEDTLKVRVPA